ncbi:hypothetical protein DL766_003181 [Monosporascus sp. MC13-8B]|uniref:Uncharacterized protein n=1 Tax=Monosporascus cannonballus TaxID=155416 RepID=A0ABY0HEH0_9PEZI|nr:hypothetical protein DL762_002078 [Monosporascus cannonballus]RYO92155.1 hypothetical protein DL763_004770 [Monosporascus cannonballus]RYP33995.1 hypothetical protein DL766_003181 [Monosporascus sp. MC13-8B]
MSADSQPISPARFAEALKDLPASSLALKVLELRNSIAFLDYSNAELKPFAEGAVTALDVDSNSQQQQQAGRPDQDCIDAIAENEVVIARMQERIELVRVEVESRGLDWREFQGKPEEDAAAPQASNGTSTSTSESRAAAAGNLTNGVNGRASGEDSGQHEAWRDGTFQTGTIQGVGDVELLQQLMDRMPRDNEDDDPEGGMHL